MRCLMIEKHKSQMCFLCPNIYHQTAACVVLSYLLPRAEKSSSSAVGTKELFPFVGMWIHHLLLIKPSEVVQSLSELIDSQRTSSVKMGKGLHFYAAAVFRQCSCLSCTVSFASVSERNYTHVSYSSLFSYNVALKLFFITNIKRHPLESRF